MIVAKHCNCRYCSTCAARLAGPLRRKLQWAVEQWDSAWMLTLTLNQKPWNARYGDGVVGPAEAAYRYVSKERLISRLVRELRRKGLVASKRWAVVLEFQKNGFPHWHVVIDAKYVPIDVVREIWDRLRPNWFDDIEYDGPPMGQTKFSAPKFANAKHAARYVTKYVSKIPSDGWPGWVLAYEGRIPRISHSRGLFAGYSEEEEPEQEETAEEQAEREREEAEAERMKAMNEEDAKEREMHRTICDRVTACRKQSYLLIRYTDPNGDKSYSFVANIGMSWRDLMAHINHTKISDEDKHRGSAVLEHVAGIVLLRQVLDHQAHVPIDREAWKQMLEKSILLSQRRRTFLSQDEGVPLPDDVSKFAA